MLIRLAVLAVLSSTLASTASTQDGLLRLAESTGNSTSLSAQQRCGDRDMAVGRYYVGKNDRTAAVGRFKKVVMQCPKSSEAEEALGQGSRT